MVNWEIGVGLIVVGIVLLIISRFYDFYHIVKILGLIALAVGAVILIIFIITIGFNAFAVIDLMIYDQETLIKNWLIKV